MSTLRLGADTVAHLIPHRRPFVFLDAITSFARAPQPTLGGLKQVSANEPVFEGHFPGLSLWPGVYTIEGMGQTVNALHVLLGIIEGVEQRGLTEADALDALRAIDKRARGGGRPPSELEQALLERLARPGSRVGFAGALEMKLLEPVYAGVTLSYRVTLTHVVANARRYDTEATVEGRVVARGTMTSAVPPGFMA